MSRTLWRSDCEFRLSVFVSDLPTQSDVYAVIYKLNELIGALARQT